MIVLILKTLNILFSTQVPGSISVWLKPLSVKDSFAVAVLNKDNQGKPTRFIISLGDIGLTNVNGYNVTEVFDNRPLGQYRLTQDLILDVDPTGVFLMKVLPL